MTEEFVDEVEAINSIYGKDTLERLEGSSTFVLTIPEHATRFRVMFPPEYPVKSPSVLGIYSLGNLQEKGDGARLTDLIRQILEETFHPGQVCLFDVLEELSNRAGPCKISETKDEPVQSVSKGQTIFESHKEDGPAATPDALEDSLAGIEDPDWTTSEVVEEKKSTFIARCARVSSTDQAKLYVKLLLSTDKKAAKATHNITAWRIKGPSGVAYQDCDDDGETAAGGRLLHLLQLMDVWNVMVIVTRWYGGVCLGPDRFRIINSVARDALVRAGHAQGQKGHVSTKKKVKGQA